MRARLALHEHPFTASLIVLLALAAFLTETADGSRFSAALSVWGYAPKDLLASDLVRPIVSALITGGGIELLLALAAVLFVVGALERRGGTLVAGASFWGLHAATVFGQSVLAWVLHSGGSALGTALVVTRDVGPSAGYVGVLGILMTSALPARLRTPATVITGAVLTAALALTLTTGAVPRDLSANLAHVIAFGLGAVVGTTRPMRAAVNGPYV